MYRNGEFDAHAVRLAGTERATPDCVSGGGPRGNRSSAEPPSHRPECRTVRLPTSDAASTIVPTRARQKTNRTGPCTPSPAPDSIRASAPRPARRTAEGHTRREVTPVADRHITRDLPAPRRTRHGEAPLDSRRGIPLTTRLTTTACLPRADPSASVAGRAATPSSWPISGQRAQTREAPVDDPRAVPVGGACRSSSPRRSAAWTANATFSPGWSFPRSTMRYASVVSASRSTRSTSAGGREGRPAR